MKNSGREYAVALADFAIPGNRWRTIPRLTFWGKASGRTVDEIIADVHSLGVTDRDTDIRRGWNNAQPRGNRPLGYWRDYYPRAAKPIPLPTYPLYVRDIIGDLEVAGGTRGDMVRNQSPVPIPVDGRAQTAAFLRILFNPADVLHIFRADVPTTGRLGVNLIPCGEWLARIGRGMATGGDLIVPNPFTGAASETTGGKKSLIAQSCLARFPFIVIEFDDLPLSLQCAFWLGLLAKSPLAPLVAAITYSGGKSLHGLLHVGCITLEEWRRVQGKLQGLLAADTEQRTDTNGRTIYPFRADVQAMRPRQGTRLPGVRRIGNGKVQSLLYLNPDAVHS